MESQATAGPSVNPPTSEQRDRPREGAIRTSDQINELAAALAKAQGAFGKIHRSRHVQVRMKTGGYYAFSYAPLESIIDATRPALSSNGLAMIESQVFRGDGEYVVMRLLHSSGQWIEATAKLVIMDAGPQARGSALTYARRYCRTMLLGVCADDDDDSNVAEGNTVDARSYKDNSGKPDTSGVPPDKAVALADRMREAMGQDKHDADMAGDCYAIHQDVTADAELYTAASSLLSAKERRAWKELIQIARDTNGAHAHG